MSKLIRHTQKRGTALFVALSLTGLTLISLVSFMGGPAQPVNPPAGSQKSAAQTQTQTAQPLTAADKAALRNSAVVATKLYEPLASQVFNLATQRAAAAENAPEPPAHAGPRIA